MNKVLLLATIVLIEHQFLRPIVSDAVSVLESLSITMEEVNDRIR